jgi:hypothetical protein
MGDRSYSETETTTRTEETSRNDRRGMKYWMSGKKNKSVVMAVVVVVIVIIVILVVWCFLRNRNGGERGRGLVTPTGLTATTKALTTTLTWNAVPGANHYNIYVSTSSGITKSSFGTKVRSEATTASLNLQPGTYFFAVSAVDERLVGRDPESALSAEVSTKTPNCPNSNLATPTALKVTAIGGGQVEVEWPGVVDAAGYNVYRAQGRTVTTTDYDQLFRAESTELTFKDLPAGSTQSFAVTALDACNVETRPTAAMTVTVDAAEAAMPEITSIVPGATNIHVTWSEVQDATSYVAYIKKGSTVGKNHYDATKTVSATQFAINFTSLAPNTAYAIAIAANSDNGEGQPSMVATSTTAASGLSAKQDDGTSRKGSKGGSGGRASVGPGVAAGRAVPQATRGQ